MKKKAVTRLGSSLIVVFVGSLSGFCFTAAFAAPSWPWPVRLAFFACYVVEGSLAANVLYNDGAWQ